MTRCEWSDLPTEDCAHCRGLTLEDAPIELAIVRDMRSRYAGRCSLCGKWTIDIGETIYLVDPGDGQVWAGQCCVATL